MLAKLSQQRLWCCSSRHSTHACMVLQQQTQHACMQGAAAADTARMHAWCCSSRHSTHGTQGQAPCCVWLSEAPAVRAVALRCALKGQLVADAGTMLLIAAKQGCWLASAVVLQDHHNCCDLMHAKTHMAQAVLLLATCYMYADKMPTTTVYASSCQPLTCTC
jgi:hypothetical protein